MSAYFALQSTFNSGELTSLLGVRDDIDYWRKSAKCVLNFEVLPHGGVRRRSGTRFICETADSAEVTRLLPFMFSTTQTYVLAVCGDGTIRFHANRGTVEDGGSPYEVAHSYAGVDLARLSFSQVNDKMWLAHRSYAPMELGRFSETDWTLTELALDGGPWLPEDPKRTTLTPGDYGSYTPVMTSASTPSGTVTGTNADAWKVLNGNHADSIIVSATTSGYIQFQQPGGAKYAIDAYYYVASSDYAATNGPAAWTVSGSNDGSTWTVIDTQFGQSGQVKSERYFFEFEESAQYEYIKFAFFGGSSDNTHMSEIRFHKIADDQTPFSLTASAVTGINDDQGFLSTDVGRVVRLYGSDNRWRWARIESWVSSTEVTIRLYDHALPDLTPIRRWQMGAWSEYSGWPGSVALWNERLTFAANDTRPVSVWGTKQGEFDDAGISDPLVATDAINITLLSEGMNEILWLVADIDLIAGSAGQVRSIGPADTTSEFSATNITQRKGPTTGAEPIKPLVIGGTIVYVARGGTKIRELVLGDQNRYVAPELTVLGEHVFRSPIVDWVWRELPEPAILAHLEDGTLAGVAYDREQKVVGVYRFELPGGVVESMAVIPSQTAGSDDVYMVVRRTIDGATKRYIEVLELPFDWKVDAVEDGFFVDCGLTYEGTAATTITGLDHLEGEAVLVLADGAVVDGLTVSGGAIELPYAASTVHVGIGFTSRLVTHPVSGPGQDGSLFGRKLNITGYKIDVLSSGAASVGAWNAAAENDGEAWTPALTEALLRRGDEMFGNKVELVTGTVPVDVDGSWLECNGQMVVETAQPLPLLVRGVIAQVESEP